ncbi:MAG: glycosyltransferase [Alphaproteobacteria bacterium]|nr:glycosyltransferase [Alphaproteobacteria bacterium]
MLVSVVIPAFGRPDTLQYAVTSAARQSGISPADLEIIVVDDASPTPIEIPAGFENARLIRLEKNAGAGGARNAGIKASRGEYVAFLDSDDAWMPGKLASQLALIEGLAADNDLSKVVTACGFYMPNRRDGSLELRIPLEASTRIEFAGGCWMCPGTTFFAHRSVFDRVGVFDTRFRRLEDYEWMLRFAADGGRLAVTSYAGAVIAPSGHPKEKPILEAVGLIRKLVREENYLDLTAAQRHQMESYLELELTAACLGEGKRIPAAFHLARSLYRQPRLTGSTRDFWTRSNDVPGDVLQTYRELVELSEV